MRFDQGNQALPGHDLIPLNQEALAAGLFTFASVLDIGEGHLFHRDSTGMFVSGGYFTRFGRLLQSFPKGDYDNSGIGASVEMGRHFKLDNDFFVEPYAQLSAVIIQGKSYDLDNDMTADGDRTRSMLGKLGASVGRNFYLTEGRVVQPYVRAAWVQEFAKNNEVQVNAPTFNNDLSGARGELGGGIAMFMTDRLHAYADVEYSKGEKIEQPYGFSVGVRYNW